MAKNAIVGQSGGPTSVINASLAGVYESCKRRGAGKVYGMLHGVAGLLERRTCVLDDKLKTALDIELLKRTPSSYLGSCRYKLPDWHTAEGERVYIRLFEILKELDIGYFFYIGGNDSMDTIAKLGTYGARVGSPIRFIGVPKTIDNDLVGTDHTPGYGSAAKFVATSCGELFRDADVYDLKSVTFVEIMGRDAGWLAGASALAGPRGAGRPDLVLLPEVPLDEDALMERIADLLSRQNTVMVGVSEGVRTADGTLICERTVAAGTGTDEFGHLAQLSGTSRYLAGLAKSRLGYKTRAVELSTLQRCASHVASRTDLDEAFELGRAGVRAALDGQTAKMCALTRVSDNPYRTKTELLDVVEIANRVKPVPRAWISADGMDVTEDFERYARPLIDGIPARLAPLAQ